MITGKISVTIWAAVERAFRTAGRGGSDYGPYLRSSVHHALQEQDVPLEVARKFGATRPSVQQFVYGLVTGETLSALPDAIVALGATSPQGAGQELLRRIATCARLNLATPLCPALDEEMVLAGYAWGGTEYVPQLLSLVASVPTRSALAALLDRAGLPNADVVKRLLELAETALKQGEQTGWDAATGKARDFLAQVLFGVWAKLSPKAAKPNANAEARQALRKLGLIDEIQETRLQLIYKAACETAHKWSTQEDAILDFSMCLLLAEFVLRRSIDETRAAS